VRLAVLAHHGDRAFLQTHRIRHTARLQQEQITINRRGQVSKRFSKKVEFPDRTSYFSQCFSNRFTYRRHKST
jgi:hypothetical protein